MATVVSEKEENIVQEEKAEAKAQSVSFTKFLGEIKEEFFKISWPSRDQVTKEFFSVLVLVFVITSVIFVLDKIFGFVVNFFTGRLF